jgi:hypothetical protein
LWLINFRLPVRKQEITSRMKQTVNEQALTLVEKKLPGLKGELTPQDAATATGVSLDEAQGALARLMELYVTRVTYDDGGNLLFAFEMPLRRRGTKTAAEKWAEVRQTLWRGFKVAFKIWIGLMVIGYFVVMVVLLLALMAARGSDRDNRRRDDGPGDMIGGLFRVIAEGLRFAFWTQAFSPIGYGYAVDEYGYRYRKVRTPRNVEGNQKSFIIAIYDLALGPERQADDPLSNEREVAAFLRAENGILTPAEIVALSGGTIYNAEERMADYLVRFKGDPTITDEGVVVGEFVSIQEHPAAQAATEVVPFWNEYEAPFEHSGNSASRNGAIIAIVGFTFLAGLFFLGTGLDLLALRWPVLGTGAAHVLLGWFPVIFSLSYLLVSLLRLPVVRKQEAARLERNRKKRVMRAIFQGGLWNTTGDEVYFTLLSRGEKDMDRAEVETTLQSLVSDLGGDIDLDDKGGAIYRFERMQREYEAAERLRGRKARL